MTAPGSEDRRRRRVRRRPTSPVLEAAGGLALALAVTAGGLASSVPGAQAADAGPNAWSGGALTATGGPGGRAAYPRSGALVSLVTSAPRARMHVILVDPRCDMGAAITAARSAVAPGAQGAYAAFTVHGRKTQRYRSRFGTTKLTATVDLAPASPGVLQGTLRVTGTARDARRPYRCDVSVPVVVRSHQALLNPLSPATVDPAALRTGLVADTMEPQVPASIAIARRADGRLHALWSYTLVCRSGKGKASSTLAQYETARSFAMRADGSFRGVERGTLRGSTGGHRYATRYAAVIQGRVDPDGIARGTVSNTATTTHPGERGATERCRTGAQRFVAAP